MKLIALIQGVGLPKIFVRIHRVHHDSVKASSCASFSVQSIVIPILLLFIPIDVFELLTLLLAMTVSAVVNHGAVELYPAAFGTKLARSVIASSHHDLHHKQVCYNYGLYFTFWDHWMKTESPDFGRIFTERTAVDSGRGGRP